jgi:16S rRNA (cytidine1402-2'-O)-methyltransferase
VLAARDPARPLAVCRELTKVHEEVRRGSAAELAAHYGAAGPPGDAARDDPSGGVSDPAPGSRCASAARVPVGPPRGEVVLVLGAADAQRARRDDALAALRELVGAGARARPAAAVVARLTGVAANELYRELTSGGQ